ncbi:hypothetical protein HK100_007971, partial [Physocladia obscura]
MSQSTNGNNAGTTVQQQQQSSPAVAVSAGSSGSIARSYAHVNAEKQRDYWDYDNLNITWG